MDRRQAVIALPEHIDVSNAGPIREELLWAINRGAKALIADLTATISCDHAGADALARAYQRAVLSGTELRIVVTAPIVRRMLSLNGLDRLVPIYPSLEAATAARAPAAVIPLAGARPEGPAAAITPAVVGNLVDALHDGVALTDGGGTLALANLRLEEMFGYEHAELIGRRVESLMPIDLQAGHRGHRAAHAQAPGPGRWAPGRGRSRCARTEPPSRPRSASARWPPPPASSPSPSSATSPRPAGSPTSPTSPRPGRSRGTAGTRRPGTSRLDHHQLYNAGLSLQAAADLPHNEVGKGIAEGLQHLDDTIREIRDNAFTTRDQSQIELPAGDMQTEMWVSSPNPP